ncbi:MAG: hypothetical protein GVY18_10000 [Bacteroidetes bacterium]|jgi:hypothetical protein|nr:hypothetical protein [Bacteroidota bacterium]
MRWLRASWTQRTLVPLLVASLGAVLFGATDLPSRHSTSYADWVRTQLRAPADAALDDALAAADEQARTFEGFLEAFVAAYEAEQPETSLARAFVARDLPPEALITYLQSRFSRVVGEAVLPRLVVMTAATSSPTPTSDRTAIGLAPVRAAVHALVQAERPASGRAIALIVIPLRTLWDAQPLGP